MSVKANEIKPNGKISLDTAGDELSDEQLAKASGGMTINAGVAAKSKLTVSTGMTAGSIAEGDTIGGDGMPDAKTG
jgi:hypothetical protein